MLDANVLYPAPVRDVLLQLAVADLYRAKWSADIHREWIEALLRNDPQRDRAALERTREKMDAATRDAVVTGYEHLIPTLVLPDPHDRHVLAAAIVGRCDVIITKNLDHFTQEALGPYGLDVRDPDDFLLDQLELSPALFCQAISKIRARLSNPPYTVGDYLATLTRCGLAGTAAELQQFTTLL